MLPWFVLMDAINPYSKGKFIFPFDAKFPKLVRVQFIMQFVYTYFNVIHCFIFTGRVERIIC